MVDIERARNIVRVVSVGVLVQTLPVVLVTLVLLVTLGLTSSHCISWAYLLPYIQVKRDLSVCICIYLWIPVDISISISPLTALASGPLESCQARPSQSSSYVCLSSIIKLKFHFSRPILFPERFFFFFFSLFQPNFSLLFSVWIFHFSFSRRYQRAAHTIACYHGLSIGLVWPPLWGLFISGYWVLAGLVTSV